MKVCEQCGFKTEKDILFCEKCGRLLVDKEAKPADETPKTSKSEPAQTKTMVKAAETENVAAAQKPNAASTAQRAQKPSSTKPVKQVQKPASAKPAKKVQKPSSTKSTQLAKKSGNSKLWEKIQNFGKPQQAQKPKKTISAKPVEQEKAVKDKIMLGTDEKRIKTYLFANLKLPDAKGYLTITNKRVLLHAKGKTSEVFEECSIDSVTGTNTSYGVNWSVMKLLIGVVLIIGSIIDFISASKFDIFSSVEFVPIMLGILSLVIGVLFIFLSRNRYFYLSILSLDAKGILIACESGRLSDAVSPAYANPAKIAMPTKVTPYMAKEIGAIIMDVKSKGDEAIEKWGPDKNKADSSIKDAAKYSGKYFK